MDMSMTDPTRSMTMSPTSTMSGMSMASSTDASGSMSSEMMGMDSMAMAFFSASNTPLFSTSWIPNTIGQYTGTCIFLIALAAICRALLAVRFNFRPLLAAVNFRRDGGLVYEQHLEAKSSQHRWRAKEAVLLALLDVVIAGVGYLLMIAVMTMNVGYFISVLAGVFVGSMAFNHSTIASGMH